MYSTLSGRPLSMIQSHYTLDRGSARSLISNAARDRAEAETELNLISIYREMMLDIPFVLVLALLSRNSSLSLFHFLALDHNYHFHCLFLSSSLLNKSQLNNSGLTSTPGSPLALTQFYSHTTHGLYLEPHSFYISPCPISASRRGRSSVCKAPVWTMPRSTPDKSKSPERISYHMRCKPSTPIEIPRRCRPSRPHANSGDQVSSPDLIFEMSPISPEALAASKSPTSGMTTDYNNNPFMYNAPSLRIYPSGYTNKLRSKISCQNVHSCKPSLAHAGTELQHPRCTKSPLSQILDVSQVLHPPTKHSSMRLNPTTKITGFIPIIEHQPSDDLPKKKKALSPPPRRSSYSSSPWILPGKGDHYEDVLYSPTDTNLDFHDHLLRRIDNRDSSSRLKDLHSCV